MSLKVPKHLYISTGWSVGHGVMSRISSATSRRHLFRVNTCFSFVDIMGQATFCVVIFVSFVS